MDGNEGNCSCGAKLRFVRRDKSGPAKFDVYECTSSKCGRMAVERTNLVEEFSIEDLGDALELAQRWLGFTWNTLNDIRKEVLVEMAFQLGTKLTKFAKFRAAMMDQDWSTAAAEMLDSRWHEQTPNRAKELARRFEDGAV